MTQSHSTSSVVLASLQKTWGGGEVYLSTLAKSLRERGYEVHFLVRANTATHRFALAEKFAVRVVQGRGRNPIDLWAVRRWIQQRAPTVLHCNDSHSLTCAGIACVGLESVRVVAMRHTMFPIRSSVKYRRLADRVIAVSYAVADLCKESGIPGNMLQVIHSGIQPPAVNSESVERVRQEFLESSGKRFVVAVGNLLECKGHRDLISAAAVLKSSGLDVRTVIAGEGDARPMLEQQISDLDLQDDVVLTGFRTDVNPLLAAADVVAHPAYQEGLCLTVAAALMLQRPVVCTTVGGLREVVGVDARMGSTTVFAKVVEAGHADQLATALASELSQPTPISPLQQASHFALQRFTAARMVDETEQLYKTLWNKSSRAAWGEVG